MQNIKSGTSHVNAK